MKNLPNNFVKIGEAAAKLGVSIDTLRRWEKAGKIETTRTPGGTRLYSTSILSNLSETPKKYQRAVSLSPASNLPKTLPEETNKPKVTTIEDLLDISRQEGNNQYQTPSTDQKWQNYVDERTVKPAEIHVHSEAEISDLPQAQTKFNIPRNLLGQKAFSFAIGALALLFLSFLALARASDFNIFGLSNPKTVSQALQATSDLNPEVLAVDTSNYYLDFSTDLIVEGDLAVGGTINGLTMAPNTDGFSISGGTTSRKLTVLNGDVTLDQDVSTQGSPSFQALKLPATSNQISMGGAGTLTWTPTGTQKITFPNATGTVLLDSATQTITNKTISGSDNTISNIQSSALSGSYTGITGVGTITTGTWNGTVIGTGYGGTGLTTYTTGDTLYASASNTLAKLPIGNANQVLTVVGGIPAWADAAGGVTSVNSLTGALTIAGGGINSISSVGTTITITGTEADTLATVTARGATTATAVTFSSTINSNTFSSTALTFAGTTPVISASTALTDISLNPGAGGNVLLAGGSAAFGCTVNDTTGDLTCSGNINGGSTGTSGFWTRAGTSLSPSNAGDSITTTGGISTTGTGTLSIAGTATFLSTINSNTFTSTALTFAGTTPVISASTALTDISLNPGAGGNVLLAGGSGSFGCTVNDTTGDLTCTGAIASGGTGVVGYWQTDGGAPPTLSPATTGANVTTSGNISTSGTGAITSGGLLTGQTGLTITGGTASINTSSNFDTNINTGNSSGAISIGNSAAGAINLQSGAASTFALAPNTATAFRFTDGTNAYQTIDTRNTLSGVSAFTFTAGTVPTIASASNAEFTTLTTTPPTITLTGTTQVTQQMDSILFNAPTITDSSAVTIDKAATFTINGAPISGSTGLATITDSYGLKINTTSVDSGTGTVTNAYGMYLEAPTGATNNYGLTITADSITNGKGLNLTSTSTGLTTGNMFNLDWSPTGSTNIYATGDLMSVGTGNAFAFVGNLFNVKSQGSSVFSVSDTAVTTSLPASFTSPGDVSIAYDLNFTNPTASYIKSNAPLYITAGKVFNSSDLVLTTYNQGSIVLAKDFTSTAVVTNYLSQINGTDATAIANTNYGLYSTITHTGNAAKTGVGLYSTVTSASTTGDTLIAADLATSATGALASAQTRTIYGLRSQPASTAASANANNILNLYGSYMAPSSTLATAGTDNVYGQYITSTATHAADAGTVNQYGLYVANGTSGTNGTSTKYGLYVETPTGADTNYAAYFAGGNVNVQSLSASSAVYTDASKNLTSTAPTSGAVGFWSRTGTVLSPTTANDVISVSSNDNTNATLTITNNTATTIGNGGNTLGVIDLQSTSLTTGNFMNIELNALSAGKGLNLTSTSTALSTGSLASFDWSPTGSTNIYSTGDLVSISTGNQYAFVGNLLNIKSQGSSVFSVSDTAVTTSLPANFTSTGDVSIAYDINFTNPTTSNIKSSAPINITPGETFNSSDLTLATYNQGSIVLSKDFVGSAGSAVTNYLSQIVGTDATAIANTNYGLYSTITHTGAAAKTGIGLYSTVTSASTTGDTLIAADLATSSTGILGATTRNNYGLRSIPVNSGANNNASSIINMYGGYFNPQSTGPTTGTTNVYGLYSKTLATHASDAGTVNQYGLYIANDATASTNGTSTKYGLYVETPSGADTNYAAIFAGGNVGIGDTTPSYRLEVNQDLTTAYVAQFFNDGNNADRYGIQIQAGADDASGTTYYLNALDGDGGQVGYIANTAGTFALTDPSDIRTKTNITNTVFGGLDTINSLRVVDFNRIANPDGPRITGFIAQEVQQVFPQMVSVGANGMLGISKETLIPVLTKAIQELSTKVNAYNLTLDANGNVVLPKVKVDQLVLSGDTNLNGPASNQNYFDVAAAIQDSDLRLKNQELSVLGLQSEVASQSARLQVLSAQADNGQAQISSQSATIASHESALDSLKAQIASLSAKIASNSASVILSGSEGSQSGTLADSSSSANTSPQNDISLNLTPPSILLATTSAQLVDLTVTSEATFSGQLTAYQATISDTFKALGDSFLGNTTVAGDFSVDGTMSITGNSISTLGNFSNLGVLYLQNSPLSEGVDFFNGQVIIDKTGKLFVQKIVLPADVLGEAIIGAGTLEIPVFTSAITAKSKVFLTATSPTGGQAIIVGETLPATGFVVKLDHIFTSDIKFNWLIIDEK